MSTRTRTGTSSAWAERLGAYQELRVPADIRLVRDRLIPSLVLAGAVATVPLPAAHFLGPDAVELPGSLHFAGVGFAAAAATAAAILLTIVGVRRNDGRAVLVGTAFTAMAALLTLHGLATPGILLGFNGVVSFSGGATLPVGGAVLALSAFPGLRGPNGVRPLLWLQAGLVVGIVVLGAVGLLLPDVVPGVPEPASTAAFVLLVVGLCFYIVLGLRALRTCLLTRRLADLLVVVGLVWLAAALVAALLLDFTQPGWWAGHVLELAGIALVGGAVGLDLHRGVQSRPLAGDLRGSDLVSAEETFLGSHIRSLVVRLAEKDAYTEEHTRRVALRAVQVGEELGLPPGRLRALAVGGLLHDIGKLSVPDDVLKKPGALDKDEYAVIQKHPEQGRRLLRELGGFGNGVLRLVHDHHERLDGSGYPAGMHADQLDLDTRILAVCDVYDALISTRVYRAAWSADKALGLLYEQAGTAFDTRCVEALARVLARESESPLRAAV
jgi:HD-GYP domain-containing protein (c-di-GMP phosphodiesterase class II)